MGKKSGKNNVMIQNPKGCLDLIPTKVRRSFSTDPPYMVFSMPLVHPQGSEPGRGARVDFVF